MDGLSALFVAPVFLISILGSIYGPGDRKQAGHPRNGRRLRLFYGIMPGGMALLLCFRNVTHLEHVFKCKRRYPSGPSTGERGLHVALSNPASRGEECCRIECLRIVTRNDDGCFCPSCPSCPSKRNPTEMFSLCFIVIAAGLLLFAALSGRIGLDKST